MDQHEGADHSESEASSQSEAPPFLVAGIGASAGGLDALTRLLQPIPSGSDLAIVAVQHMARDQQSLLPGLLAARTGLQVAPAEDGQRIEPGRVYVIQPNTHMAVEDGVLHVCPRPNDGTSAIDALFDSMASDYRERAVVLVLSGTGRDGVAGAERVRRAGGLTMAQQPEQAKFDAMPRATIAAGVAELVLPAEQLADELVRLSRQPFFRRHDEDESASERDEGDELQVIFQLLQRETGVDFARYKRAMVERRVKRRMALHQHADAAAYSEQLRTDPSELCKLHDDILINVTSFFRDPEAFEALRKDVLPGLNLQKREQLRAWVPGCSSGEEAYSLAMTLLESFDGQAAPPAILVFGTDLSERMIERARAGVYPESIASEIPQPLLERYFTKLDSGYRVGGRLRESCVFARQDITRDPPFSRLDIILCRNVLIYLDQRTQARVIGVFHYALRPEGVLMLGRSETAGAQADLFAVSDARWKIYRRRAGGSYAEDGQSSRLAQANGLTLPQEHRNPAWGRVRPMDPQSEAQRLLVSRFAPPSVLVDGELRVARSHGDTADYLELPPGDATLDILRLIRPGLLSPLRAALAEARGRTSRVRREGLQFLLRNQVRNVNLEVTRLGHSSHPHFLILFEAADEPDRGGARPAAEAPPAIIQLQEELAGTRLHLQSMIQELETANEELQAANEEILSSNEELQSTNEELDTAREELQSSNEELSTVNDELHARNGELSRANSDLVNLLGSVQIAILMVTSDLRIRRFTPAAERLLNLIPSDLGRPIGHIKPSVDYPDLEQVMRDVVQRVETRERQVRDAAGNTYVATVRPYKNVDNRIDGAVLALFDVSNVIRAAWEAAEAIVSTVREPVVLLDSDHAVRTINRAFAAEFAVSEDAVKGRNIFQLWSGAWNRAEIRELLQDTLPTLRKVENFELALALPGTPPRSFALDGRCIQSERSGERVVWLTLRESGNGKPA